MKGRGAEVLRRGAKGVRSSLFCWMSQLQQLCRQKLCERRFHFFIPEGTSAYVWSGAHEMVQGPTWHRVISKPVAGQFMDISPGEFLT